MTEKFFDRAAYGVIATTILFAAMDLLDGSLAAGGFFFFLVSFSILLLSAPFLLPGTLKTYKLFVFLGLTAATLQVISPLLRYSVMAWGHSQDFFAGAAEAWRGPLLFAHILAAIPCTLLGPFLLMSSFRTAYPHTHRAAGKWYVLGIFISAALVLPLTLTHQTGWVSVTGFTTMAALWFAFTFLAYRAARQKKFPAHRRFMFRSYALTLAFVHVNFTYPALDLYAVFGAGEIGVKVMQSMASWMINLVIVEIYLAATTPSGRWIARAPNLRSAPGD